VYVCENIKLMNYFGYRKNELFAEDVPIAELAKKYGTPLFVYSGSTLKRHIKAYEDAFKSIAHLTCFAVKANSNIAVLDMLGRGGAGADVVSGGELFRAIKAGIAPEKIVYAGVGKTEQEIRMALKAGILMFNIESEDELATINMVAAKMRKKASIALRVNPDIDAGTHPYITTGLKKYKFGIPVDRAIEFYRTARAMKNINVIGIHKHIGSQITEVAPFADALARILALVDELAKEGIEIKYIDMGGGLGIPYSGEKTPSPKDLAKAVLPMLNARDITLVLEPGRSIVGNAGVFITKTLYLKEGPGKTFVIVDGGMNDLIRPTLYEAYHEVLPVTRRRAKKVVSDVVGPICETGDFLAKDRELQETRQGDLLAVMSAGAYGFTMSSNYNSRPRAAEVMVQGNKHTVIRKRETLETLIAGEKLAKGF
jgi:diaminopimelate decarboxylase